MPNGDADATSAGADDSSQHSQVRIRGIYTTALTRLLADEGNQVVQASPVIRDRFDEVFATRPADVRIETTRDGQGVELSGPPAAIDRLADRLSSVAIDAFAWAESVPRGAVYDVEVLDADGGRGGVVDLGQGRRGYLRYDDVDGYVDAGNRYRVQVSEPTPPWSTDRPRVTPTLAVENGLCTLTTDRSGVSADVRDRTRAEELVGMTDLLSATVPDGWGLRWQPSAAAADLDGLDEALTDGVERVRELDETRCDLQSEPGAPGQLAQSLATRWVWFGRESRFALDAIRRQVTKTLAGHHRIKAGDPAASAAVDFAEAVCGRLAVETETATDDDFPFAAVARQFGPVEGDRLTLVHGKPDGRRIELGTGTVTAWDPDGSLTLERTMRGGGSYDALDEPIEEGDVAVTNLREGRWWYPTTYRGADGTTKGTYVNVCTPVECFPDEVCYVDLYVDVIKRRDGSVSVVDTDELTEAETDGLLSGALAEKARTVASAVERALS